MRVIAGEAKGRRIVSQRRLGARPTTQRVRSSLFAILESPSRFSMSGRARLRRPAPASGSYRRATTSVRARSSETSTWPSAVSRSRAKPSASTSSSSTSCRRPTSRSSRKRTAPERWEPSRFIIRTVPKKAPNRWIYPLRRPFRPHSPPPRHSERQELHQPPRTPVRFGTGP